MSDDYDPRTAKQIAIFDFIVEKVNAGLPPTVRELQAHFGLASPNGMICHLRALEKKGFIKRDVNKSRGIHLVKKPGDGNVIERLTKENERLQEILNAHRRFHGKSSCPDDCYVCAAERNVP